MLTPLLLSILGAVTDNLILTYLMLAGIVTIVVVVSCTNWIPAKLYPVAVFSLSLALLYQTTLIGSYLVGNDIHLEYYSYQQTMLHGWHWNQPLAGNNNTAIGLTVIAPFLTRVFHISGFWIFKAVYPLLYGFAPVLLYLAFKQMFGSRRAFLSCFFLVSVPTYLLEIVSISKQQLSGVCIAALVFLLFYRKWPAKWRLLLAFPLAAVVAPVHYSSGYILLYFAGVGAASMILAGWMKLGAPIASIRVYLALAGVIALVTFGYFSLLHSSLADPLIQIKAAGVSSPITTQYATNLEPVTRAAFGIDFLSVGLDGKVFRALQLATEAAIVVGFGVALLRARRHQLPRDFIALCGAGISLLLIVTLLPAISSSLNMSRFYFFTLTILAPLLILGGERLLHPLFRKRALPILVLGLLVPYFLFTSGVVFSAEHKTNNSTVDIPYSIALSHSRLDVTAMGTKDDDKAVRWIAQNLGAHLLFTDFHGTMLLSEQTGQNQIAQNHQIRVIPEDTKAIEDNAWVYLRSWSIDNHMLTYKSGVGLRTSIEFAEAGISGLLEGRSILFQSGSACVYGGRE